MATMNINGKVFTGNNIVMRNGRIIIDGVEQTGNVEGISSNIVEIKVTEGIIQHLDTDASVNCNNVTGNVKAGGSINCDDVGGNVTANGSVICDSVAGSVSAGGSIRNG